MGWDDRAGKRDASDTTTSIEGLVERYKFGSDWEEEAADDKECIIASP